MTYLYEVLRNEVMNSGDDALCDENTIARIVVYYSELNLPPEVLRVLGVAIKDNYVDYLHRRYIWDEESINQANNFADSHSLDRDTMVYVAEAFAFAIELIDDVKRKKSPKQKALPKRHKLTTKEIDNLIKVKSEGCPLLVVSCPSVIYDGTLTLKIKVYGHFTDYFKGGVFCVSYYDENGVYKQGWHRTSIHTIPWSCFDKKVFGCEIEMELKPIWSTDNIGEIRLSFENATNYPDLKKFDTDWVNYNEW